MMTPERLTQFSAFYHQLSSMIAAGMGVLESLEILRQEPPGPTFRRPLESLIGQIKRGQRFGEALQRLSPWLPPLDVVLIQAGEQGGRLDLCLRSLGDAYAERAQLTRQMMSALNQPALLLHLAVLVFPVSQIVRLVAEGDLGGFVTAKIVAFAFLYGIVGLLAYAGQARHGERIRTVIDQIASRIPLLGSARHQLALARFAGTLEALVKAGLSTIQAWDVAISSTDSPAFNRIGSPAKRRMLAGEPPSQVIGSLPIFPATFAGIYKTGEVAGKLDETLAHLRHYHQAEASRQIKSLAELAPQLFYLAVLLGIASQIVSFWQNPWAGRIPHE
jgi:type IV pilus assembly protein PilC